MLGLGNIMKLARGGMDLDQLSELLTSIGMRVTMEPLASNIEGFRPLVTSASLPSAKLMELRGTMADGAMIHAVFVLNPAPKQL